MQQQPTRTPLYTQLNASNKPVSVTQTVHTQTAPKRKRHHRTNSGSPRSSGCSRTSNTRTSIVVNAETQTDEMDISETDLSPSGCYSATTLHSSFRHSQQPQRVIMHQITANSESDEEGNNGNVVHLHYMAQHPQDG